MVVVNVLLDDFGKVKKFSQIIGPLDIEADLGSGRHCVDAKSIMGIYSISTTTPLTLAFRTGDADKIQHAIDALEEFVVK